MLLLDYDEFNIYTNLDDVEIYVSNIISQGIEIKEEIYSMCLEHFGSENKHLIDKFFADED